MGVTRFVLCSLHTLHRRFLPWQYYYIYILYIYVVREEAFVYWIEAGRNSFGASISFFMRHCHDHHLPRLYTCIYIRVCVCVCVYINVRKYMYIFFFCLKSNLSLPYKAFQKWKIKFNFVYIFFFYSFKYIMYGNIVQSYLIEIIRKVRGEGRNRKIYYSSWKVDCQSCVRIMPE